jgi:3-oxoacyl-[acyl-carrier-protein] synthase-1
MQDMKRVVVTGMGTVSSIGNNVKEVLESLREGKSGISSSEEMAEYSFRSRVEGRPTLNPFEIHDKRTLRFMAMGTAWSYVAMLEAVTDANLTEGDYKHNPRTGIIMGSGGSSTSTIVAAADITRERGSPKRIGPLAVPKTMSSTASANLAVAFGIQGVNHSITAACATSAICIGSAFEQIQMGKQDVVFAGGCEDLSWTLSNAFDAMGAMSSNYNKNPTQASRAYDNDRDGFVIAGGAGVLVCEEYEHALERGAHIYAEIVGYGHTSDGTDMVIPSGEGAVRCMRMALGQVSSNQVCVDYINTHATSTPAGDVIELLAINEVLDLEYCKTKISGTKCLTGHSLGAVSVQEAIFTILMMQNGFVSANANVENLDPKITEHSDLANALVLGDAVKKDISIAMSNSFGFGGTNASLIFQKI